MAERRRNTFDDGREAIAYLFALIAAFAAVAVIIATAIAAIYRVCRWAIE